MSYLVRFSDINDCNDREDWARKHCPSFLQRTITDVEDVSPTIDTIYDFYFADEKDAAWFRLRWS